MQTAVAAFCTAPCCCRLLFRKILMPPIKAELVFATHLTAPHFCRSLSRPYTCRLLRHPSMLLHKYYPATNSICNFSTVLSCSAHIGQLLPHIFSTCKYCPFFSRRTTDSFILSKTSDCLFNVSKRLKRLFFSSQ